MVFGAGAAAALLSPAAQLRLELDIAGRDQRANARRAADLMRRQGYQIGADRRRVERNPAGRLHRVAMKQRAVPPRDAGDIGDRLYDAGLVVGEHDRNQRGARVIGEKTVERIETQKAVAVDRDAFRRGIGVQDRVMLHSRNQHAAPSAAADRQIIGLGAAAREDYSGRGRADQRRHRFAIPLDCAARSPTPAMHRGGIAATAECCGQRRQCFRAQRRCCVPVEIGCARHLPLRYGARGHCVPVAAARSASQWRRPLVPSTRRSQTSASDTELKYRWI